MSLHGTEFCLRLVLLLRNKRLSICNRRWRDINCTFASGLFLNSPCLDKHKTACLGSLPSWSGEAPCYTGRTSAGVYRGMNKENGLLSTSAEKSLTGFDICCTPWRRHLIDEKEHKTEVCLLGTPPSIFRTEYLKYTWTRALCDGTCSAQETLTSS
ncbi:Centromere Protein C [Manis pentadactyla]|nr:Centromere Protein C [Manis pentadactyla]